MDKIPCYQTISEAEESIFLKKTMDLDPDKVYHYLKLFSEWISTQKCLPQDINQNCRKKFLVWAKLDMEKAKNKFIKYCYTPLTHKDFVADRKVTRENFKCLEFMSFLAIPKLTQEKCRITMSIVIDGDHFDILEMSRFLALAFDCLLHVDSLNGGFVIILDMAALKTHHYSKLFNITYFRFLRFYFQMFPHRVQKFLIVNLHPNLVKGMNLSLPLFPEKLRKRILILNSPKDLHKHVPPECLPSDYGGTERSKTQLVEDFTKTLLHNADLLERMGKIRTTGPIPKEFRSEDEFGVEGSFRKLNID